MSLSDLPKLLRTPVKPVHKCYLCTGFKEVLNNFGRSDNDKIQWKNAYFHQMHLWFHAQLAQKILNGIYLANTWFARGSFQSSIFWTLLGIGQLCAALLYALPGLQHCKRRNKIVKSFAKQCFRFKIRILFSKTNKSLTSCASNPKNKHYSNKLRISGNGLIFKFKFEFNKF